MLRIANFNPIESINVRLKPWGFAISTKQQMISKIALASLAMLTINNALLTQVEAACRQICTYEQICEQYETYWTCTNPCPEI